MMAQPFSEHAIMRYKTISILTVLAAVAFASPLAAQGVQGGSTVRATLTTGENETLVGTLVSRTADSLVMLPRGSEALVRLPSSSVRAIEVMNGKNRIGPAVRWGVIGGGVWALVAAFVPFDNCNTRQVEFCSYSRAQFVAGQAFTMAIAAGAIGAYRGEDRWVRIEGPAPSVFVAPSTRGVSAGLRVGF
jgi:hypothetical protein